VIGLRVRYQPFKIPTGAMQKTLLIGDHLWADNWAYDVRIPFLGKVLWVRREPQRGDVVTFLYPEERTRVFIKRVIGLPGETVAVRGKAVYIDGHLLKENYTYFGGGYGGEPVLEAAVAPEALPSLGEGEDEDESPSTHFGPALVPAGHLFVMGDNRDNSKDSRYWGFLSRADLRGQAARLYWSQDPRRGTIRFRRIGQRIE
jgi:signal peptidase I